MQADDTQGNPEDKRLTRSEREEKILNFWQENQIFKKTLEKKSPKGEFIFYEGPPTANGKPGFHHLEARAFKDAIPRYKTMQGFHVPRKAGWDTHGLPVELEVEKNLGLKSKKEIETYGIAEFNKKCKESVGTYIEEWRRFTDRIGYWMNLDDAYFTYDNSYISTVWSVIAKAEERKLLYKDYKVVPWCPRCGTGLSSHELAQGYKDVKDLSVYAKFKIVGFPNAYFLAWTTTPWTLPGNVALAVGADIIYVEAKVGEEILVLAKERLSQISEPYEIVAEHKGSEMVGMEYEPLFPELRDHMMSSELRKEEFSTYKNGWKVYTADFVTTTDGTGIVHTAVMYGQEDFELGTKYKLPKLHTVDDSGKFVSNISPEFLWGRYVKEKDENGKPTLDVEIIDYLKNNNLFYSQENYKHDYPHCWRCGTPLIYYARNSWYIRMSDLRDDLVKENQKINWEPDYIKDGRFGEWLKEVKDWAISRERYWGTPLPIWQNSEGERIVVDSLETLKKYLPKQKNKYIVMRHGQAENNVNRVVSSGNLKIHHLSDLGKSEVGASAKELKKEGIDFIVASPFLRTTETAQIVAKGLGLDKSQIFFDERLSEYNAGNFDTKSEEELHAYFLAHDLFATGCEGGESFYDVQKRLGESISDLESKYDGKTILIVTHKICGWLITSAAEKLDKAESNAKNIYLKNAEFYKLNLTLLPHNENFELDLHKPYIDSVVLQKDGKEYTRVKEVMDVWFDSGSMPFAQDPHNVLYPADFISEAIDQTRGWFYTLHAVGNIMERGSAFKNAICLGHILDKDGKKMSKSIGNVINPWEMIDKYGVDTLRLWMYSVNQPGESKNFDERSVEEIQKRLFNLLDNVHSFYELYRDRDVESEIMNNESKNILDKWIFERLNQLIELSTDKLDNYKLLEPVREMRVFMDDLSTWYLRRSRDRIKSGDKEAKATLHYVLMEFSKLLAPFAPFAAEDLYQKLKTENNPESVHLAAWPKVEKALFSKFKSDSEVIPKMQRVREIVTLALDARSKANIKIRQPLSLLRIKNNELDAEYLELIKEELNVKSVVIDNKIEGEVELDTTLTPELEEEGRVREIIRNIQDLRKEKNLKPTDTLPFDVPEEEKELYSKYAEEIKRVTNIDF